MKNTAGSKQYAVGTMQYVGGKFFLLTACCLLLTFLLAGQSAFAEEQTDRYRLVNLDGLGAVFGMARLEYQQNINGKSAWALRGVFWRSNTESWKWDAYGSGFLSAIIKKKTIAEAMKWGSINASSVISKIGSQDGLLTKKQMESILSKHDYFQARIL